MPSSTATEELETSIQQFYERYSAKRVALAAFMVGVFTIGLTYVAYAVTTMALVGIIVFGVVGLISVNLTMIYVVPPARKLTESCEMICMAIREPSRIKSADDKGVRLADKVGEVHALSGPDLEVWTSKVVPYFMQVQSAVEPVAQAKSERTFTPSERRYIEERRREVLEIEKRIEEERKELEKERRELEKRSAELREWEKKLKQKEAESETEEKSAAGASPEAAQQ
ncbi:hypothetical protein DDZ13_03280 [Coraliomargarita sinensis]|uniref:Uncharacterized protein n=1 Tax=Coraliomargarita sinensis TaxID=2174842 RepID=A0A317ZJ46_9BACT|nr:hypothetical protein [Coraliomargarita sinensis]PXA05002.1 hypothetical protein DDZ13_03280 [Coraliomargarita sinensis]